MGEIEFYQNFNHKKGTQLGLKINLCSLRWINLQYRYLVDYRYASPVVHCVFSDCCCVLLFSGGLLDASGDLEDGEIPSADSRLKTSAVISAVDSPASPDISAMVTGSPVKIIPASPPRKDEESGSSREDDEEEEEEDIDEDILYLRLIALRSMAAEEKAEGEKESREKQVLAREMQELLDEAEEAASYENYQNTG